MNQIYYFDCLSGSALKLFAEACVQLDDKKQLADMIAGFSDKLKDLSTGDAWRTAEESLQTKAGKTLLGKISSQLTAVGYSPEWSELSQLAAAVFSWEYLEMKQIIVSDLSVSSGTCFFHGKKCAAPLQETLALLAGSDLTIRVTDSSGPLLDPISAAFYKMVRTDSRLPDTVKVYAAGVSSEHPDKNQLRIIKYVENNTSAENNTAADEILKLESNIDDTAGESLGFVMEHLLAEGALDVFFTPIQMKKNRPAVLLTVLCKAADQNKMEQILFMDTTTIGIRRSRMERTILKRTLEEAETSFGKIQIKVCRVGDQVKKYPEYESIARICRNQKLGYQEVYKRILADLSK